MTQADITTTELEEFDRGWLEVIQQTPWIKDLYALVGLTRLGEQQTPTPNNALGAKGVGEAGTIGSTPAIQNAVIDAVSHLGVRHIDMPLTAERVWRAIQGATA